MPGLEPIKTFPDASTVQPSASPAIEYLTFALAGSASTQTCTSLCFQVPVLGFAADASTVVLSAFTLRNTAGPA